MRVRISALLFAVAVLASEGVRFVSDLVPPMMGD